jgi:hypothetical protein
MLERFLYSLPPRGTSLLVASSTVVVGEARPMDINTVIVFGMYVCMYIFRPGAVRPVKSPIGAQDVLS